MQLCQHGNQMACKSQQASNRATQWPATHWSALSKALSTFPHAAQLSICSDQE